MKKIINNRNEYLNSLSIKKNDRHKYIISNTESLNKIEITQQKLEDKKIELDTQFNN